MDPDLAEAHLAHGRLLWTPSIISRTRLPFPHEAAIKEHRRALGINPSLDEARNHLAVVYVHVELLDQALQESDALMNKPEQAMKWLEMAADEGFPCYPLYERDSSLDNLRQDPRFVIFLAKLRKQWEYYKTVV